VYSDEVATQENRVSLIGELFDTAAVVATMKTGKELLVGAAAIIDSFSKTLACPAQVSKRIFIEGRGPEGANEVSYCLDFHSPGSTPGLGDRAKDGAVLYKCQNAKIIAVWGLTDSQKIGSKSKVTKEDILASTAWKLAEKYFPSDIDDVIESHCHYHDYSNIEVWG